MQPGSLVRVIKVTTITSSISKLRSNVFRTLLRASRSKMPES